MDSLFHTISSCARYKKAHIPLFSTNMIRPYSDPHLADPKLALTHYIPSQPGHGNETPYDYVRLPPVLYGTLHETVAISAPLGIIH